MIAHVCQLKTGEFVHTLGDAHIYKNHLEPLKKQVTSLSMLNNLLIQIFLLLYSLRSLELRDPFQL